MQFATVLEGSGSPIEAILAEESVRLHGNGAGKQPSASASGEEGKGSLADRIRALQARASRVASAT